MAIFKATAKLSKTMKFHGDAAFGDAFFVLILRLPVKSVCRPASSLDIGEFQVIHDGCDCRRTRYVDIVSGRRVMIGHAFIAVGGCRNDVFAFCFHAVQ